MATQRFVCPGCGQRTSPAPGVLCEICTLRAKAERLDALETERYIEYHCRKAGIERNDPRIRFGPTKADFENSLMRARLEDLGEIVFEKAKELDERELELAARESAGREAPPRKSTKQTEIDSLLAEREQLREKGRRQGQPMSKRLTEIKSRLRQLGAED